MRIRTLVLWSVATLVPLGCASGGGGTSHTFDSGVTDSGGGVTDSGVGPRDGDVDSGSTGTCAGVDCSGLDEGCMMGVCDPADGHCSVQAQPDATACDDGDPCTMVDTCTAGMCGGVPLDCSAMSGACTTGACDASSGLCVAMPAGDGAACDDGDACTEGGICSAGACAGSAAVDCSSLADACHTGSCDPVAGCMATPAADGTTCDDSDACTVSDVCTAGSCAGGARDCSTSGDACNAGVCDSASGTCGATPLPAETLCDDGNVCTSGDSCSGGTCTGTPILTGACGTATVTFPSTGDTVVAAGSAYFWRLGDYVQGSRGTSLPTVSSVDVNLSISPNGLTCDSQDVELRINGVRVGTFSITGGTTNITRTFSFGAIAGPSYLLRYQTIRQVGSGCGAAGYPNDVSTVTLHP